MLIVDCFTFYNEFDLLTYRLNILNPHVDYFILVESKYTHVGKEKPLLFLENKAKYEEFNHKIIHIIVYDMPHIFPNINISADEQWINERFQRDCIKRGLDKITLSANDIILINDLDEIVDPSTLQKIKEGYIHVTLNSLGMSSYYYNLNTLGNSLWTYGKILTYEQFNNISKPCSQIRLMESPIIYHGGWHLSYFGDTKFIKNKIENFAHQEFNNDTYTNLDSIQSRMERSEDVYGRSYVHFRNIPINDNTYLPPEYIKYLSKFILA